VSKDGLINMPLIGTIRAKGYSTRGLEIILEQRYAKYLAKTPTVKVDMLNQKIYVLGEVKNPGAIAYLKNPYITPLKAISQRGGLSDTARRGEVFIIRGTKENNKIIRIDLKNMNALSEFSTTLQAEDIVFVASNNMKNYNLGLNGMENSVSLLNTLFNAIIAYKSVL